MAARNTNGTLIGGNLLLGLLFVTIFLVPTVPVNLHDTLYRVLYTVVFFVAVMALEKRRALMLGLAVGVSLLKWVAEFLDLFLVNAASQVLSTCFFAIVVLSLIAQIARKHNVTTTVIVAALNGYLLLGLIAAMLVSIIAHYEPAAFNFAALPVGASTDVNRFSEHVYYGFVTFTTVGYGDVVPQLPYTRSLAILTGVAGQMYVAIIIAMLVGKYASRSPDDFEDGQ